MLFRPLQSGFKLDDSNGHCALIGGLISNWVRVLTVLMHLRLKKGTFVSHNVIPVQGSPKLHSEIVGRGFILCPTPHTLGTIG
jgi:hypothetical protein